MLSFLLTILPPPGCDYSRIIEHNVATHSLLRRKADDSDKDPLIRHDIIVVP